MKIKAMYAGSVAFKGSGYELNPSEFFEAHIKEYPTINGIPTHEREVFILLADSIPARESFDPNPTPIDEDTARDLKELTGVFQRLIADERETETAARKIAVLFKTAKEYPSEPTPTVETRTDLEFESELKHILNRAFGGMLYHSGDEMFGIVAQRITALAFEFDHIPTAPQRPASNLDGRITVYEEAIFNVVDALVGFKMSSESKKRLTSAILNTIQITPTGPAAPRNEIATLLSDRLINALEEHIKPGTQIYWNTLTNFVLDIAFGTYKSEKDQYKIARTESLPPVPSLFIKAIYEGNDPMGDQIKGAVQDVEVNRNNLKIGNGAFGMKYDSISKFLEDWKVLIPFQGVKVPYEVEPSPELPDFSNPKVRDQIVNQILDANERKKQFEQFLKGN